MKLLLEYIRFKDGENSTPLRKENLSVNTECPTLWSETRGIMHTRSTPLIKDVEKENISLVKLLLGAKVPVDERDDGKRTALYYAAGCGNLEIMNMLIDGGADVNIMDNRQLSPLWVACDRRKGDAVLLMLLRRSAKVQLPIERARWTNCTMCQAAKFAPIEVMGALCERSVDHYNEPCYRTPLWEAVTAEKLMAVKCLIMYGCFLDTPGRESSFGWEKRTLLHDAIDKKNLNVLNVLITAGAFTNKTLFECSRDNALHGDYVGRTEICARY